MPTYYGRSLRVLEGERLGVRRCGLHRDRPGLVDARRTSTHENSPQNEPALTQRKIYDQPGLLSAQFAHLLRVPVVDWRPGCQRRGMAAVGERENTASAVPGTMDGT